MTLKQLLENNFFPLKLEKPLYAIVSFFTLNTLLKKFEKISVSDHKSKVNFSLFIAKKLQYSIISFLFFYMLLAKSEKIGNLHH